VSSGEETGDKWIWKKVRGVGGVGKEIKEHYGERLFVYQLLEVGMEGDALLE
jgi:hypothetical protein